MRHIKLFEDFNKDNGPLITLKTIKEAELYKYGIRNYTVNDDGTVDVDGDVYLGVKKLKEIPFKFGIVTGDFDLYFNQLTSLEGAPRIVGGNFGCDSNRLKDLKGSPEEVGGDFNCYKNILTSVDGMPLEIGGDFDCQDNKNLKELDSLSNIEGIIYCDKHIDISKFQGYCKEIKKEED